MCMSIICVWTFPRLLSIRHSSLLAMFFLNASFPAD